MPIKILGGLLKGTSLQVPPAHITRPTSVLLKRRLFDSHQNFNSCFFIDCFAGSGSVGLEAWSRGASKVLFIENNKSALNVLKNNIKRIEQSYPEETRFRPLKIISKSAQKWVEPFIQNELEKNHHEHKNIIFIDPPYKNLNLYYDIIDKLQIPLQKERIHLWLEGDKNEGFPLEDLDKYSLETSKTYSQGTKYIATI